MAVAAAGRQGSWRRLSGLFPGQGSAASCGADHRRLFWAWTGFNSAPRGAEPCGVGLVCRLRRDRPSQLHLEHGHFYEPVTVTLCPRVMRQSTETLVRIS